MAVWEGKKYKLETSENFDDYMKELGVGFFLRKIGNSINPTIELIKNGDEYTLNTESTFKNTTIKFKLGQEFDEETIDGRNVKSIIRAEGNKFTQEQAGDKPSTIIREFGEDSLRVIMKIKDIECVRVYNKVE